MTKIMQFFLSLSISLITILRLYIKKDFFPPRGNIVTHTALYRKQNREMETYKLPIALTKVDPSGPNIPLNASKISKVH